MEKISNSFDPRGLIYESYRIDGIHPAQCRSIFLDWALGVPQGEMQAHLQSLIAFYTPNAPDHPMTEILLEGVAQAAAPQKRRGGRKARIGQ